MRTEQSNFSKRSKCSFLKKRWGSRGKSLNFLNKSIEVAKLPQNRVNQESVGFLDTLGSRNRWFFRKRNLNFWKQLNLANLMSTATETVSQFDVECEWKSEISQNLQKLVFLQEKMSYRKKTLKDLKMARDIKFGVESNWKSKISQNVQTFGCYKTIRRVLQ